MSDKSLRKKYKVLFFDVNETLLDLGEVRRAVGNVLSGDDALVSLWFRTMLHYSLVANAIDEYRQFSDIGAAALQTIADQRNIEMSMEDAKNVLSSILTAPPHSDVPKSLQILNKKGYRMAALTNSSRKGMEMQLINAGIDQFFEKMFSVEEIGIYKPERHVYRWAAKKMNVLPNDCLFVAAHGWDIAGAKSAGMFTAFLNRPGQSLYPLTTKPTFVEDDLQKLCLRF